MTRLSCGGLFNNQFVTQSLLSPTVKEFWNCQHLPKLRAIMESPVFFDSRGIFTYGINEVLSTNKYKRYAVVFSACTVALMCVLHVYTYIVRPSSCTAVANDLHTTEQEYNNVFASIVPAPCAPLPQYFPGVHRKTRYPSIDNLLLSLTYGIKRNHLSHGTENNI